MLNKVPKVDLVEKVACEQRPEAGKRMGGPVDLGLGRERMQVGEQLQTRS